MLSTSPNASRLSVYLWGTALALALLGAWHGTFQSPFIFDDFLAIADNPTIRHLWPPTEALHPPTNGSSVTGRPLVNLSLALNYAISGDQVWSYHALNLLIHIGASLALFGVVRRTLLLPLFRPRFEGVATPLGLLIAALWGLHPLQTESVTCIIQRTESLMGLFYLLIFYAFVRGAAAPAGGRRWLILSVIACALGTGSKEVTATAPVLVLLFDRTFIAGSFREAWRARWGYYLGLASTWLLLGALLVSIGGSRGDAAGFGFGITPWTYAFTQCWAIIRYLRLIVWPDPLILDYGTSVVPHLVEVWPHALVILLLLAGTIVALWKRPVLGFLGAWFFVILAPSSSFVPLLTQTVAEHRMYLPLASVAALIAVSAVGRWRAPALLAGFCIALVLGGLTILRNEDYRDPIVLWRDTVAKRPTNPRAHGNLATYLQNDPRFQTEAYNHFETALQLMPYYADAHYNLANFLAQHPGAEAEAITHFEATLRLNPNHADAHVNLANLLAGAPGRRTDALMHYEAALRLNPGYAEVHNNMGILLGLHGDMEEAARHFEAAVRLKPDYAEAHNNLGTILARQRGREAEALAHFETAVRLRPDYTDAVNNLNALRAQGR